MKNEISVEARKAQVMVEQAMGDITRATRKVLMDYVSNMYLVSFAKAIAYLGLESEDANSLLNTMDADTRRQVEAFAKDYQKSDAKVISEVEHIVTASGMDFTDDYKIIKDNIILSGKTFAENAVHNFQKETPIFKKKIEDCLFCFEDFQYLDDRAIQKVMCIFGFKTEISDCFCKAYKIHIADIIHKHFAGCSGNITHCLLDHRLSLPGFNRNFSFHKHSLLRIYMINIRLADYHSVIV